MEKVAIESTKAVMSLKWAIVKVTIDCLYKVVLGINWCQDI